jgi:hypothetical protein
MVTPDELRALLKQHHWIIAVSTSGKQNVYAAKRRQGKKVVTRYIGTERKLNDLTEESILAKLTRSAPPALVGPANTRGQKPKTPNQEIGLAAIAACKGGQ